MKNLINLSLYVDTFVDRERENERKSERRIRIELPHIRTDQRLVLSLDRHRFVNENRREKKTQ